MIDEFYMNGLRWKVRFVDPDNDVLIDRTLAKTVGVTDPDTMTIYLSNQLSGSFLNRVLIHELGHCVMYSYNLVNEIHRMCKKRYWIEMEEFCAQSRCRSDEYGINQKQVERTKEVVHLQGGESVAGCTQRRHERGGDGYTGKYIALLLRRNGKNARTAAEEGYQHVVDRRRGTRQQLRTVFAQRRN